MLKLIGLHLNFVETFHFFGYDAELAETYWLWKLIQLVQCVSADIKPWKEEIIWFGNPWVFALCRPGHWKTLHESKKCQSCHPKLLNKLIKKVFYQFSLEIIYNWWILICKVMFETWNILNLLNLLKFIDYNTVETYWLWKNFISRLIG